MALLGIFWMALLAVDLARGLHGSLARLSGVIPRKLDRIQHRRRSCRDRFEGRGNGHERDKTAPDVADSIGPRRTAAAAGRARRVNGAIDQTRRVPGLSD